MISVELLWNLPLYITCSIIGYMIICLTVMLIWPLILCIKYKIELGEKGIWYYRPWVGIPYLIEYSTEKYNNTMELFTILAQKNPKGKVIISNFGY